MFLLINKYIYLLINIFYNNIVVVTRKRREKVDLNVEEKVLHQVDLEVIGHQQRKGVR